MEQAEFVLTAEDAIEWEGKFIFVPRELNLVCSVDLNARRIEIVGSIPEEEMWGYRLCAKIVVYDDNLYFLPMNGKKVWKLDLKKHDWHSIEIEDGKHPMKMMQAVIYQKELIMIGCSYPAILCMDLESEKITYIKEPFDQLKKRIRTDQNIFFRCDYARIEEMLFLACCLDNSVLKMNLSSLQWEFIKIGNEENRYSGIAWDGCHFWLSPRMAGTVVRWDGQDEVVEFPIPDGEREGVLLYTGVCSIGDKVVFPAKEGRYTLEMEIKGSQEVRRIPDQYLFYKNIGQDEIIYGKSNGELAVLCSDGTMKKVECRMSLADILRYWKSKGQDPLGEKIMENADLSLKQFLSLIAGNSRWMEVGRKETGTGEKIWNKLTN